MYNEALFGMTEMDKKNLLQRVFFFILGHGKRGDFHTRIICITDGRPTDFTAEMSCDDSSLIETERVAAMPFWHSCINAISLN